MGGFFLTRFRNYLYDHKLLKTVRPSCYVISVGNITWGGTGKTSLIKEIATHLLSKGIRTAILSRGYHRSTKGAILVSDGKVREKNWERSGDEATFLASTLPDAVIVVAEDRSKGLALLEPSSPDVILLDDAFQHRKMERDLDLVLIDASEDLLSQKVIPLGKLREEIHALSRADAIVLTHQKRANSRTTGWVAKHVSVPIFHADYVAEANPSVRGKKIGAFCGIATPGHFFELLEEEGAELVLTKSFRDHHPFSLQEIQDFRRQARAKGAEWIATTAKDAVRIHPDWFDEDLVVIRVKLHIKEQSLFFEFVMDRMNKVKNPS